MANGHTSTSVQYRERTATCGASHSKTAGFSKWLVSLAEDKALTASLSSSVKVYNGLVPCDASPDPGCTLRGDTHAFGNTEESLIHVNKGVKARNCDSPWSNVDGVGRMAAHVGCYNDAINVKRNEMWLVIHNLLGGINSEGAKLFNLYRSRAKRGTDRTDYMYVASDAGAHDKQAFAPHGAQLLSAAIIKGDARRSLRAVDKCREECLQAAASRHAGAACSLAGIRPPPPPPPLATRRSCTPCCPRLPV